MGKNLIGLFAMKTNVFSALLRRLVLHPGARIKSSVSQFRGFEIETLLYEQDQGIVRDSLSAQGKDARRSFILKPKQGTFQSGRYRLIIKADNPNNAAILNTPVIYANTNAVLTGEHAVKLSSQTIRQNKWKSSFQLPFGAHSLRFNLNAPHETSFTCRARLRPVGGWEHYARTASELARDTIAQPKDIAPRLKTIFRITVASGPRGLLSALRRHSAQAERTGGDYKFWIKHFDLITQSDIEIMKKRTAAFKLQPVISVVMPVYNTPILILTAAIDSVISQTYDNWQLCIADDASTDPKIRQTLQDYAQRDSRIKIIYREANGHISRATNSALELATGDWVTFLDHDDQLAPHALYCVADEINKHPGTELIYSDEDKIDIDGTRQTPYFKTDWNYDLFLSQNMVIHLAVYRLAGVRKIGGLREGYEGAQDYDLTLRYIETISTDDIRHLPFILYHWRIHEKSTALSAGAKDYASSTATAAITDHFKRISVDAEVVESPLLAQRQRVIYALNNQNCHTTIIIPTRNALGFLKRALDSVFSRTVFPHYDVIVINNGSDDPGTLQYLADLPNRSPVKVRVLHDDRPFNYSALNNAAVREASGKYITLLNNDVEILSADWLRELVSNAQRANIGCVGARLFYPDMTLQHAGVVLGVGGVAGHIHKHLRKDDPGYFGRAALQTNCSAVTAACLTVSKDIYIEAGGLDERLKVAFNDIDFCLRVQRLGYQNVWSPYVELIHFESKSRGTNDTPEKQALFQLECNFMHERWGNTLMRDPFYSYNLTLGKEDSSFSFPPRVQKPWLTSPNSQ